MQCRHSLRLGRSPLTWLEIVLILVCVLEVLFILVQIIQISLQTVRNNKMAKEFEAEKAAVLELQKNGTRVIQPLLRKRK